MISSSAVRFAVTDARNAANGRADGAAASWSDRAPWRARTRGAEQQPADAEVLVDVRPVNALAFTDESPVAALLAARVQQAREPRERHRQPPTVGQVHDQVVVVGLYTDRAGI